MLRQVQNTINEFHMTESGDKVIIGVSGGADSMCLFTALQELADRLDIRLHVVHVNHLLRKEAGEEEEYVRAVCRQQGIPCTVFRKNIEEYAGESGCSIEEAGRNYRYECFEQVRVEENAQRIAVAHHQNDRAETLLFHMIRGTGMRGLGSIPAVRGRIIRPLIQVSRQEIEMYLKEKQIPYYTDSSNASDEYSRNVIRNQVLPVLEDVNQKAVRHITEISDLAQEYWTYVEKQAMELEQECVTVHEGHLSLQEERFARQSRVVQRHLIYRMLSRAAEAVKDIEQVHVEQVLALLDRQTGKQVSLPYGLTGIRTCEGLEVWTEDIRKGKKRTGTPPIDIKIPGLTKLDGIGILECEVLARESIQEISKKPYTKMLDYGKIKNNLCIRNPMDGDYFIVNRQGEHKKLSRFFIDNKVPKEERGSALVLAAGHQVCWIIGMRISEDLKITEATDRVLQIRFQYEGEENEYISFNFKRSN